MNEGGVRLFLSTTYNACNKQLFLKALLKLPSVDSKMKKGRATIEVGADGVAVITIINPPVNSLSLHGILINNNPSFQDL